MRKTVSCKRKTEHVWYLLNMSNSYAINNINLHDLNWNSNGILSYLRFSAICFVDEKNTYFWQITIIMEHHQKTTPNPRMLFRILFHSDAYR